MQNFYETLLIVAPEADEEGVSAVIGDLRCFRLAYGNAGSLPTW